MKIYRDATIFDHSIIAEFLVQWLKECEVNYPAPDGAFAEWITHIITKGWCIICEDGKEVIGIVGCSFTHFPWNSQLWVMNNDWLYVREDRRKEGIAQEFIKLMKEYAKDNNIPLHMAIMSGKDCDRKDRFFEINNITYVGGNFIYGL